MKHAILFCCCLLAASGTASAAVVAPGLYERAGHLIYVGIEHELPDAPQNQFFDPVTQHTGTLNNSAPLHLRRGVREFRRIVIAPEGPLGVSLYYSDGKRRATIVLVHGNDPETRDMGFVIPYFVASGLNVISYDQRGTGDSTGNWFLNGPVQRAQDVVAIYDAFRSDGRVHSSRIGIWGFSNGGWTAPIVTLRRPIAFMILKSAPAESLKSNIDYEVVQLMRRHRMSRARTQQALTAWHDVEAALNGEQSWSKVQRAYAEAKQQRWFSYSLLPDVPIPPPAALEAGVRRFISYDPVETLQHVRTPTLALYGKRDRNVDASDSSMLLKRYFRTAGMRDFTMRIYPNAGHSLIVSRTGYNGDAAPPERFVAGYPQIMTAWLSERGFTAPTLSSRARALPQSCLRPEKRSSNRAVLLSAHCSRRARM